ncbi:uncharacterized protein B0T15DRAFT_232819 [Chaetomium strumarium]|uniref:SWIM-type domain-containing protein n=1 Tax=Chaetomium strumarium TaxID=1170767 RepID=A0AAJ0M087_9PEZI|nr:hypothetical protein B0T15DRAFT_232819 [Chaetomium strumarium]
MQTTHSHPTSPPLPTSRALLTSLITSISNIPLLDVPDSDSHGKASHRLIQSEHYNSNPLRRVPPSHRHLITTLHVLFPGMVLPALDLLERGFVSRVIPEHRDPADGDAAVKRGRPKNSGAGVGAGVRVEEGEGEAEGHDASSSSASAHVPPFEAVSSRGAGNAFYFVGSASAAAAATQSSMRGRRRGRRRADSDGGAGTAIAGKKGYVVRLEAWHCTCAAFAFATVQGEAVRSSWEVESLELGAELRETGVEREIEPEWSFGGTSLDGLVAGEGIPVCKHLLACVLAERWSAVLGGYVVECRAGREEIAGIVADV